MKYEPNRPEGGKGEWCWWDAAEFTGPAPHRLPPSIYAKLKGGVEDSRYYCRNYLTREAALADLEQAMTPTEIPAGAKITVKLPDGRSGTGYSVEAALDNIPAPISDEEWLKNTGVNRELQLDRRYGLPPFCLCLYDHVRVSDIMTDTIARFVSDAPGLLALAKRVASRVHRPSSLDPEDIVQDAVVQFLVFAPKYSDRLYVKQPFLSWIEGQARDILRREYKKEMLWAQRRLLPLSKRAQGGPRGGRPQQYYFPNWRGTSGGDVADFAKDAQECLIDERLDAADALAKLPPHLRRIIVRHFDGMGNGLIARELGSTPSIVSVRIHEAKTLLEKAVPRCD
jgi:RNA polymerase sigma factor (sigma-70 family)